MKRCKRLYLLIVMMMCSILCGCHAAPQMTERAEIVETVEVAASQEKFESTASLETKDTDAELEKDKEVSEADINESPFESGSSELIYQELLDGIYDLILAEDKETDLELAAHTLNGILDAGYSRTSEETLESVGYALWDMNADGMPELVIGGISDEREGKFFGRDIYAVYTCVQEDIDCICSGWSRSYVGWMGENTFYYMGSGGASYTIIGQYELLPNSVEWSCINLYFTDENGIYHNQTGIYDKEYAETLDMTWNEFWELNDKLYDKVLEIELTPFSAYPYSGEKTSHRQNHAAEVTVQWAEEVLSTVADYDEYIAYSGDFSARVAFTTENSVADFKVLALQFESIDEEGNVQFLTTELYDYGMLTADRVFVVEMIFEGTIPQYGISYMDDQGNTRLFSVNISGYDGSLVLQEIVQIE